VRLLDRKLILDGFILSGATSFAGCTSIYP
jgi:hypothetical protein